MRLNIFLVLMVIFAFRAQAAEGMFPLSELQKLDLKKAGLQLTAQDIFSAERPSLSDAIVKLGGCTASFISAEGLLLTNHHCAFRAVQSASDTAHNYLRDGFYARERSAEIQAKGYTVRITESYYDVSSDVLSAVQGIEDFDFAGREKALQKKKKEIELQAEKDHPGKRAEVAEMFKGQSYYLFIYTYLKDVRLVYVPPRAVGEFGGDYDNWEWPRHNADFSILRAYVAPDGSPAEYAETNVPYRPKTFLHVNPQGVKEGDAVFILGYPGRTYRHRTSYFLDYQQNVRMPAVVDWYGSLIAMMEDMGLDNPAVSLKLSSAIKGLANTEKNYRGKLLGLSRLNLLQQKRRQEQQIQQFILEQEPLKKKYQNTLGDIAEIYAEIRSTAPHDFVLYYLRRNVTLFNVADVLYRAAVERPKEDLQREAAFMDRNFERTQNKALRALKNYYRRADVLIFLRLLDRAARLPQNQRIPSLDRLFTLNQEQGKLFTRIENGFKQSQLSEADFVRKAFKMTLPQLKALNDPVLNWRIAMAGDYRAFKEKQEAQNGALSKLSAQWAEVKRHYLKTDFIPDANGTFRLTYGSIRGYSPADAVYMRPFTTLRGVLEKDTGRPPFNSPQKLLELIRAGNYGRFASPALHSVPVCMLYDTDTTGGNSGSPVMNAKGELIGLNFDRTFQATINDFAWNESYSRSIGVDVRYILWLLQNYAGADNLLQEMGVGEVTD